MSDKNSWKANPHCSTAFDNHAVWDEFYHFCRMLSVSKDNEATLAAQYAFHHLVSEWRLGGNYPLLLRYSEYYGERFILPTIRKIVGTLCATGAVLTPLVIDLGAGRGWLGNGLATPELPPILVDKRSWSPSIIVYDVERSEDLSALYSYIGEKGKGVSPQNTFVVSCELLHCVKAATVKEVIAKFKNVTQIHICYEPLDGDMMRSYVEQTTEYGSEKWSSYYDITNQVIEQDELTPACKYLRVRVGGTPFVTHIISRMLDDQLCKVVAHDALYGAEK